MITMLIFTALGFAILGVCIWASILVRRKEIAWEKRKAEAFRGME